MKKYQKIVAFLIVVLLLVFFGNRLIFGSYSFSNSCGTEFTTKFEEAVKNKDFEFCSNYKGEVAWRNKLDPFYGNSKICEIKKTNTSSAQTIFQKNFARDCSINFVYSAEVNNIETCSKISDKYSKMFCIQKSVFLSKNKENCNYLKDVAPDYVAGCKVKMDNYQDMENGGYLYY